MPPSPPNPAWSPACVLPASWPQPYYGETQKLEELKRTEDDWRLILAKRHAKRPTNAKGSGSTAASQREADGAAADGEEEEEEEDALTALCVLRSPPSRARHQRRVWCALRWRGHEGARTSVHPWRPSRRGVYGAAVEASAHSRSGRLNGKRQREEDDETTREQVHEEMALRMDTGVRVNKALQSVLR
jgi:hypothetical protein